VNQQQYLTIISIGAKLLGTFDSSIAKAQARLKALQRTATEVSERVKALGASMKYMLAGFASFAIGAVFKKIFTGAFEEAAKAQERMLAVTNEFSIHMLKQGRAAAEKQTEMLFAYNKELAKTGVISHQIYDAMTVSLSKIGLSSREIAEINPVLADVLVRARGIRASTEDATELGDTLVKVAKGARSMQLLKFGILLGTSERERLKAYKDDWRGALSYLMFFLKQYKGFNQEAARTPLGQIQRMHNLFDQLSEDIGTKVLPAQADMAAAWEKALPTVEPVILGAMEKLAELMSWVARQATDLINVFKTPEALKSVNDLRNAFAALGEQLGLTSKDGLSFGQVMGTEVVIVIKAVTLSLKILTAELKVLKWLLEQLAKLWKFFGGPTAIPEQLKQTKAWKATVGKWIGEPIKTPPAESLLTPQAKAAAAAMTTTPAYAAPGGYGYGPSKVPPPMPTAPAPWARPVSRIPITPAMPSVRVFGGVGGGAARAPILPPGATMPYGGGMPYGGAVGGAGFGAGGAGVPAIPVTPSTGIWTPGAAGGAPPYGGAEPMPAAPAGGGAGGPSAGGGGPATATPYIPPTGLPATSLVAERAALMKELQDPAVAARVFSNITTEVGSANPARLQAYIETIFNRALARHKTLMQTVSDTGYYPGVSLRNVQVSAKQMEAYRKALDAVAAGGNITNFATGNESGSVHSGGARVTYASGGERFVRENPDVWWSQRQQAIAASQVPAPPPMIAAAYQLGGIAKTPQIATLAERGPEMVLPLVGGGARGIFGSLLSALGGLSTGGGGDTHHYNFSPNVSITGNAGERTLGELDIRLRNIAREFINGFKEAQRHERRLSYESGYGS